ncbi:MAG TPA: serine hydrolase [Acidobacteriota bacterium]
MMRKTARPALILFSLAILIASGAAYPRESKANINKNIKLLQSGGLSERMVAIIELGNCGRDARAATPFLLLALDDAQAAVRESSAEALGKIGRADKKTILALAKRFADEDPFVAGKAVTALATIGGPAVEYLIGSLADARDDVRWCAAIALGKIAPGGGKAIPFLAAALKDKNPDVRWCAAIALGKFKRESAPALPELLRLLDDDDRDVRWAAYVSLGKIDAGKVPDAPATSALIEKLESLTPRWLKELKVPGAAISVIRNREVVWSKGFGVTDAARPADVNERTVFEACSMSKPVFAYLALELADKGKLELDKPLGDYVPEPFVEEDDEAGLMTARMMLAHTGGMPNWRKGGEERDGPLPVYFKPGTKFSYSGEGMYYLQRVVEHITREPLAAYAQRELFDKLGLASTSFVWSEHLDPQIATGHDAAGVGLKRSRYTHANAAYTLYTTPGDYARFITRIMKANKEDGASLSVSMTDEMLAHQARMDTREVIDRPGRCLGLCAYRGLGWAIDATIAGDIAYHSGSNQTGFTCYSQFNRQEGSGIVIMTNGKNGSELWSRLISAVGDL